MKSRMHQRTRPSATSADGNADPRRSRRCGSEPVVPARGAIGVSHVGHDPREPGLATPGSRRLVAPSCATSAYRTRASCGHVRAEQLRGSFRCARGSGPGKAVAATIPEQRFGLLGVSQGEPRHRLRGPRNPERANRNLILFKRSMRRAARRQRAAPTAQAAGAETLGTSIRVGWGARQPPHFCHLRFTNPCSFPAARKEGSQRLPWGRIWSG